MMSQVEANWMDLVELCWEDGPEMVIVGDS